MRYNQESFQTENFFVDILKWLDMIDYVIF
jgi:hypothetical protein